jgi:hypothetical protein
MRISRPLAGIAIAAGTLGASLGLGLTMASASTTASPAVTHRAATAEHATRASASSGATTAGLLKKPAAGSSAMPKKASGQPCRNMSGHGSGSASSTAS